MLDVKVDHTRVRLPIICRFWQFLGCGAGAHFFSGHAAEILNKDYDRAADLNM